MGMTITMDPAISMLKVVGAALAPPVRQQAAAFESASKLAHSKGDQRHYDLPPVD